MTVFKRAILFGISLLLVIVSLPYLMFKDLFVQVNQTQLIFNFVFGLIIATYNFLVIYREATTVHIIVDSESVKRKMKEQKGENNYV